MYFVLFILYSLARSVAAPPISYCRAAVLIPVIDTLLSLLASVTLFSVLGVLAHHQQVNISQVLG